MKEVCDECLRYDVDFLIEAGSQPAVLVSNLVARLRVEGNVRNVAVSFDSCEAVLYGAEDPVEAFNTLKAEICQIHLRDCKQDRAKWCEDCPWG